MMGGEEERGDSDVDFMSLFKFLQIVIDVSLDARDFLALCGALWGNVSVVSLSAILPLLRDTTVTSLCCGWCYWLAFLAGWLIG